MTYRIIKRETRWHDAYGIPRTSTFYYAQTQRKRWWLWGPMEWEDFGGPYALMELAEFAIMEHDSSASTQQVVRLIHPGSK